MLPQLVIITGLSGSGMSSAMNVFEDLGYFCVDNLPVQLIPSFVQLFEHRESHITHAALGVNIREGEFLKRFPEEYARLRGRSDLETTVIFLEASDASLQRRYPCKNGAKYSAGRNAHTLERQSRIVTIAGRGCRARSA